MINEYPALQTNIITHGFDVDAVSGYPTFGAIANVSKSTSRIEVCGIEGMKENESRSVGINATAMKTNALELSCQLLAFPTPFELLQVYRT